MIILSIKAQVTLGFRVILLSKQLTIPRQQIKTDFSSFHYCGLFEKRSNYGCDFQLTYGQMDEVREDVG